VQIAINEQAFVSLESLFAPLMSISIKPAQPRRLYFSILATSNSAFPVDSVPEMGTCMMRFQ
jgi:hypothetical protein